MRTCFWAPPRFFGWKNKVVAVSPLSPSAEWPTSYISVSANQNLTLWSFIEMAEKSRGRGGQVRVIFLHILHLFNISSIHHEGHGARLSRSRRRLVASYALYTAGLSASIVIIILGPVDGVAGGRWGVSNSFCAPAGTLCRSPSALVLVVHAATASRPSRSPS